MTAVVPYAAGESAERVRAFLAVCARLSRYGYGPRVGSVDGEWCKAAAVADALPESGTVIVHDADVIVSRAALAAAVDAVRAGAAWAVPHRGVFRLSDEATVRYLADGTVTDVVRPPYEGVAGGGIVVLDRETYAACPLDRRFIGWGSEDEAWGMALRALYGDPWRGDADLVHLWHPHPAPGARRSPRLASVRLWRAYRYASRDPERMRVLLAGAG